MDMQFTSSCLEVNIAERLQPADFKLWEFDEDAAISGKAFKVDMTLTVQIGTHLLDLKVGHIAYSLAQSEFMRAWAAELKALNQASLWQHLAGRAYHLRQTHTVGVHAGNVCAACNPDISLVFPGS